MVNKIGYWGPVTATLDWCEYNYSNSFYIAEFYNSISNVIFLLLTAYGLYRSQSVSMKNNPLIQVRFLVGYAIFALVGLGSFTFHATLLYSAQLLDELPMIYCALIFVFFVLEDQPKNMFGILLVVLLVLCGLLITVIYLIYNEPVFHQICYGILVGVLIVRCYRWEMKYDTHLVIKRYFRIAVSSYILAFTLWNIDVHFCEYVRYLLLHSWWHFFTAYGTYLFIVVAQYQRSLVLGCHPRVPQHGPWQFFPYVTLHHPVEFDE